jgi:hypothetical protein
VFVCLLCQSTVLNWKRGEGFPLAEIVLEAISVKFAREASGRATRGKRSRIPAVRTLLVRTITNLARNKPYFATRACGR